MRIWAKETIVKDQQEEKKTKGGFCTVVITKTMVNK